MRLARVGARRFCVLIVAIAIVTALAAVGAAAEPAESGGAAEPGALPREAVEVLRQDAARARIRHGLERDRLRLPDARAQRGASRRAFAGLGAADAAEVVRQELRDSLAAPAERPLAGVGEAQVLADGLARMPGRNGEHRVMTSTQPLGARDASGRLAPLDLTPVARADRFGVVNGSVELQLPKQLGDGIRLHEGLTLTPGHGGKAAAAQRVGGALVYANAVRDSDVGVRPTATGVETFEVLRSADSPELLTLEIGGTADLRLERRARAVYVLRGDRVIARIGEAFAHDADGQLVPVSTDLVGSSLHITVEHRERDVRYPILVDPPTDTYTWECSTTKYENCENNLGTSLSRGWNTSRSSTAFDLFPSTGNYLGAGLYVWVQHSAPYPTFNDGHQGAWQYQSPGTTSIERVDFSMLDLDGYIGNGFFMFTGIWGTDGWAGRYAEWKWDQAYGKSSQHLGNTADTSSRAAAGMQAFGTGTRAYQAMNIGRATVTLRDFEDPTASKPAVGAGWSATNVHTFTAHDPGTGVVETTSYANNVADSDLVLGCNGAQITLCTGKTTSRNVGFPEGVTDWKIGAKDAAGRVTTSAASTIRVDWSVPVFDPVPTGDLYSRRAEPSSEKRTGTVVARDGDPFGTPAARRSGVARIEVWLKRPGSPLFLNEQKTKTQGASCTVAHPTTGAPTTVNDSCPLQHSYEFNGEDPTNPEGTYTIQFRAYDHVGNPVATKEWSFVKDDPDIEPFRPQVTTMDHDAATILPDPPRSGWVDAHTATLRAGAEDLGSGLYKLELREPRIGGDATRSLRFKSPLAPAEDCDGSLQRPCPAAGTQDFTYGTAGWREGYVEGLVTAVDAHAPPGGGNRSRPDAVTGRNPFELKVDHTAPTIGYGGPRAQYRDKAVLQPGKNVLEVIARDGAFDGAADGAYTGADADARSGVASTDLRTSRDGAAFADVPGSDANGCPTTEDSCEQRRPYEIDTAAWGEGVHRIETIARDRMPAAADVHQATSLFRFLIDLHDPVIDTVSPDPPVPAHWIRGGTYSMSIDAHDSGSGVRYVIVSRQTAGGRVEHKEPIRVSDGTPCDPLDPHARRCPRDPGAVTITLNTADIVEGVSDVIVSAEDAAGRRSAARRWPIRIDRTAPALDLTGEAREFELASGEILANDVYDLDLDGQDGTDEIPRSGVVALEVFIDDVLRFRLAEPCPQDSCDLGDSFELQPYTLAAGDHTIRAVATDAVGHTATHEWQVRTASDTEADDPDQVAENNQAAVADTSRSAGIPTPTAATVTLRGLDPGCRVFEPEVDSAKPTIDSIVSKDRETTVFFTDGGYRVSRCNLDGTLATSMLVGAVPVPGTTTTANVPLDEAVGLSGRRIAREIYEYGTYRRSWTQRWQAHGAALTAAVIPPTTLP